MAAIGEVGTGSTVATAGFTAEILDITLPEGTREKIDSTHMTTTVARTNLPTELVKWGTLDLEILFDPAQDWETLLGAAPATVTVTPAGDGDTWVFTGYLNKFQAKVPLEDRMTASCSFKVCGDIVIS